MSETETKSVACLSRGGARRGGRRFACRARIVVVAITCAGLVLSAGRGEAAVTPDLRCKDGKAKAAGKRAQLALKAFGANAKTGDATKWARSLSKAESKFTKGFALEEGKGGCATVGDAAAIGALTDGYVGDVVTALCAPGTPTTTTPLPTTTTTTLPAGVPALVIAEVMYDPSSADDGFEWVELKNTGATSIDLSTMSLGYGGTDYTGGIMPLSGSIAPGAVFVVGGPASDATNASPTYDLVLDFNPDLQNSGTVGDGLALFDVPATEVTPSTVPIDAVVYGPNNDTGLIDESGGVNPADVGDAPGGSSIERTTVAGGWQIQSAPTPNSTPF
jgi:hypothetical protein